MPGGREAVNITRDLIRQEELVQVRLPTFPIAFKEQHHHLAIETGAG